MKPGCFARRKPLVMLILDGYGLREEKEHNAIAHADTPNLDRLFSEFPHSVLEAAGEAVGLPEGQMGGSEVGHQNMGAGRVVYQDLVRINKAIREGDFFKNKVLLDAIENVKMHNSALHIMGLLSDGGVHSHINHMYALLELAGQHYIKNVYLHAFLDGRDKPPKSALPFVLEAEKKLKELCGTDARIATVSGRYYAMDRDKRWDRTEKAYNAMTLGEGFKAASAEEAVNAAYARGETDEFVLPTAVAGNGTPALISGNDSAVFFNFRTDRTRELTQALTGKNFAHFERRAAPKTHFVCFTQYDKAFGLPVAFPPQSQENILAEVLSRRGIKQLRIAETEKYAHVTFFFNGTIEAPFAGEDRILVPSPKVATYDLQPEMSAHIVTDEAVGAISRGMHDVIIINYANLDLLGHTGIFDAAVKSAETVDACVGRVFDAVKKAGGLLVVTADHGNAERMKDEKGDAHTAHTCHPVPFIFCDTGAKVRDGILADIAPTILDVLNIEKPEEMSGRSLRIN